MEDLDVEITSRQRSQALRVRKPDPGGAVVEQASLRHMSVGAAWGVSCLDTVPSECVGARMPCQLAAAAALGFGCDDGGDVCIVHFFKVVFVLLAELAEILVK